MPIRLPGMERPNLLGPSSELEIDHAGWLHGPGVVRMPAHPSWHYSGLSTPDGHPAGVVWHYTATKHGTAKSMAKRRTRKRNPAKDRAASWHISLEGDGTIWQMISLLDGAWHCRGQNRRTVGIELVGHGDDFPKPQVWAAIRLVKALRAEYSWASKKSYIAGHRDFDPTRRRDPGDLWDNTILPAVLREAGLNWT